MRKLSWIVLIVIAVGAIGVASWYLASRWAGSGEPIPTRGTSALGSVIVSSLPAERTFSLQIPWIGTVESLETGDQTFVQVRTAIIRLGGFQVDTQRARLQAAAESAQSQLELARQTVQRLNENVRQQLATRDQLAGAQESQIKLQMQRREAQLALESFERQVNVAAPMAGVFTNRRVSPGQAVSAGEVLGEVIDPNHLRIVAALFPPVGIRLEGMKAAIRLRGDEYVVGTVVSVLPQATSTGATRVWIEGPAIDARLSPGQTAGGYVTTAVRKALGVPQSAIVYDANEQPYLFTYEGEKPVRRRVHLGLTQDGWVEVRAGLTPGQRVVTQGAYELLHREFSEQFKVED
jgi:membrane fusion protein (multidrug efflux system)